MSLVHNGIPHKTSLIIRLANIGMTLLFPGFLVYHLVLSAFSFPAILQGLFGPVSSALCLSVAVLFFARVVRGTLLVDHYAGFVIITIFYMFFWTTVYGAIGEGVGNEIAVRQSLETVVLYFSAFSVGVFFSFKNHFIRKLYISFFWIVVVALVSYVMMTGKSMFYANQIFQSEQTATYQGYGRSMMVISILILAWTNKAFWRIFYAFFSLLSLFILGGRSELFGFAFFVILLFAVMSSKRYSWAALTFVSALVFVAVVLFFHDWLLSNRAAQVLDLSSASSWLGRVEFMRIALLQINESPILGQFGGHLNYFGLSGAYAHNILSAWVNYGLAGFLLIFILTAYAFIFSVIDVYNFEAKKPVSVASMGFNAVSLLLLLVAKPVFWPVVALGWGIYVNSRRAKKSNFPTKTVNEG